MTEGWYHDEYLVLFEPGEASMRADRYGLARWLPGYRLLGICGWDDLLVADGRGGAFKVPAIPLEAKYLEPYRPPSPDETLVDEPRVRGRIKWYLMPLIFGGSPDDDANIAWVSLDEHAQLVVWWNERYHEHKDHAAGRSGASGPVDGPADSP